MIDLNKFCGNHLNTEIPWSKGQYSYATNGYILIRVSRRKNIPEVENAPDVELPFFSKNFAPTGKKESVIPELHPQDYVCIHCGGEGYGSCNFTGKNNMHKRININESCFSDLYLSWIAELPNSKIYVGVGEHEPSYFTFDGGDGLLMPMRKENCYNDN